ncbi:carbohydrate binding family 9 domain-containing protein [Thalassomonas viridans]|uniref:Carbohydrate binding family 9 domain-containing protein n=1 Tax=Thalassomonas viridans TaxID=137584 RepID=A0AAE9Z5W9_9GAMM|nr:carbohydrate binding family 9 domain-containing protein [Thalassomonas viridans]WDE07331.1 carbohydrate binding family 9 domain-containing protein [Thalassomonas viridans]
MSTIKSQAASADTTPPGQLHIPYSSQTITIDGEINDRAWQEALEVSLNIVNDPWENKPSPVTTRAKLLENGEYIYIAFIAADPEPENIKGYLTDRDSSWTGDLVGIKLDTFNNRRLNYEFFVNPFGVQHDGIANELTGESNDLWDGFWQSYGKKTADGFQVEMAIPYSTLNFKPGTDIKTWAIELVRLYPRDERLRISHIPLDRDNACWICQMPEITGFKQATMGSNLKITPSLVASQESNRDIYTPGSDWQQENDVDAGVSLSWGLSADTQLNATINPDFSNIETDSAQLTVNKNFSLFYDEKRAFFLENADYFASNYNLVHTRNISDPDYGLKLTGRDNNHSYGVFVTNDTQTSYIKPGNLRSSVVTHDKQSHAAALNYRYEQSEDLAFGVTSTLRINDDYHNALLSVDSKYRISETNTLIAQLMHSDTRDENEGQSFILLGNEPDNKADDQAFKLALEHDSEFWRLGARHQQIGKDFRADLGFITRADFKESQLEVKRLFYPENDSLWTEANISSEWTIRHNEQDEFISRELVTELQVQGPYLSEIDIEYQQATKTGLRFNPTDSRILGNSEQFDEQKLKIYGEFQPTPGIFAGLGYQFGDQIDYNNNRLGELSKITGYLQIHATDHLYIDLYQNYIKLDADRAEVYTENLVDLRLSYQFDVKSALKLSLVYSDVDQNPDNNPSIPRDYLGKSKSLSSQLIYSYKLNPQSVFYLGYSDNSAQDNDLDRLERRQKTFFCKVSYSWIP